MTAPDFPQPDAHCPASPPPDVLQPASPRADAQQSAIPHPKAPLPAAQQPEASAPRLHIALFQPEIPQNTGNVGRLCALTLSRLHLIHPLGFTITDRHLKRSGMDYWYSLDVHHHADWDAFDTAADTPARPRRWLLTTKATRTIWEADFRCGDLLLFGNEGHGAPPYLHAATLPEHRITIPQFNPQLRSLNLSTAVGIVAYEALRQINAASGNGDRKALKS